jgi:hypothetical protein
MPSHVKTIAGAKEVMLEDGSAAMLVIFTDGDYTWWVAEDESEISAVKLRAGETIIISAEDPPEILDAPDTMH